MRGPRHGPRTPPFRGHSFTSPLGWEGEYVGAHMSSVPALQIPVVTIRTATPADHDALQTLEGAAPDAGANLIQARRNFFARMAAYDRTRVLVAEQNHLVVGVLCLALTPVRVAGRPCPGGCMFNIPVAPRQHTRRVGRPLMNT